MGERLILLVKTLTRRIRNPLVTLSSLQYFVDNLGQLFGQSNFVT